MTTIRAIFLIALSFHTMVNLTRPLIPLYATELGAGTMEVGFLTAAYAVLPLLLAISAGKLADLVGDRVPIILGAVGLAIGLGLPYLYPSIVSLYASQGFVGISHILITISLQNVLGHAATKETRDHVFGMFSMFVAIGAFLGPVLGGYLAEYMSYRFAFLVSTLLSVMPLALAFLVPMNVRSKSPEVNAAAVEAKHTQGQAHPEQPSSDAPVGKSPLQLLRLPELRKALASSALVLYSRDIFVAYFPLFAVGLGISDSSIGWIIAVQGLAMMLVRLLLGRMTVAYGRERVLLASICVAGFAFLLVPIAGHVYALGLLSALMGLGLGCGQPLSMTTTYNASPKSRTGEVLGLRLACNRLSQLVAPVFFGLVGNAVGLLSVFYVSGAFLLGGALLTRSKPEEKSMNGSQYRI
ncbi:MFS transporter [Paenibacillus sp. YYML68]|uniref:MFS transporter n=1 Tax=Paenibacillus sp. YYML68 TaxID=2909250 RepID=UPI002490376F|nr:MFS transporter [Paenibacillus sp. YYML68]